MQLDLKNVLGGIVDQLPFEGAIELEDIQYLGNQIHFSVPVQVSGKVSNIGKGLELEGKAWGRLETLCGRCGKPAQAVFSYSLAETIVKQSEANEETSEEVIVLEGNLLDMHDIVLNGFYAVAETKYLCSADCKGLCPYCGADRNVTACECCANEIDPRLAVLDTLFDETK